ncbi:uncharacterized protein LOC111271136 [Varroa jacobsoni]|uniref:Uncharacterized protein n=1 Tax=Varroa destructor TaxID=109461 RepID=A0A7M7JBX6_VARDE|nr:uncharacterized protein LOC111245542 [Varroa destructor]XP_022707468.1 uncharacterized protein LOC111271136 [Varroa jacobsoni]
MSADAENATNDAEFASGDVEDDAGSGVMMCETCYNNASQLEADAEDAKCDVCDLRSQLAECQQQVADRDARIAELEAQVSNSQVEARIEEALEPDARPHLMAISDGMFTKMRIEEVLQNQKLINLPEVLDNIKKVQSWQKGKTQYCMEI